MNENNLILGCIADDFTGASDAASFLVKGGLNTLMFNGVPKESTRIPPECSAIVIALKTRTQDVGDAVKAIRQAAQWLKDKGVKQLFLKYCSTFDSTKKGNIGPTVDCILEEYGYPYTILCPALPVNKRVVKQGRLYVDGIPLNESHMKNHPLTPMWESDIAKLMEPQGKYQCLNIDFEMIKKSKVEIQTFIDDFGQDKKHFYVVPDFVQDDDAEKIVEVFGDLPLLTGGSGLMEEIGKKYSASRTAVITFPSSGTDGNGLIIAGSCSKATLSQIVCFQNMGGKSLKINPLDLLSGKQTPEFIWSFIEKNAGEELLIYSSDNSEQVKKIQTEGIEKVADLLEKINAQIGKKAVECGYTRIIVAGGETSGAVTKKLGFDSFLIGESIAPGVPIMIPLARQDIRLVLKSGNFGQEDFFIRALQMTKRSSQKMGGQVK